ncbi:MAG: DUF6338 family protein [Pelodictyon phaeoclathratiforme]|jgi:hypothetical protein
MSPKIDAIGLKILFLLIPGIIAFGIVKSVGPKRPRSDFESGLQIFVYGVFCYLITGFLEGLYLWQYSPTASESFWQIIGKSGLGLAILNPANGLDAGQIVLASVVALFVGFVVATLRQNSFPHRYLVKLGLKRIGEVDIWDLTLNSPSIDHWVTVRHHNNGKIYQGYVWGYSDGGDERELLMTEVMVFAKSEGSEELVMVDTIPVLYLGLDRKNAVLEFSSLNANSN